MQRFLVEAFVQQYLTPPTRLVLDLDSTDFVLHGHQLGRFFHGYYDAYCYLPLYIFCGDHPLLALLRPSNIDNAVGVLKHLSRIIARLRECWPGVAILVRGDSGCRDHLMHGVRKTASISSSAWPRTRGCCGSWSRPGNRPGSSSPKRVKRRASSTSSPTARTTVGAGNAGSSARPSTWPKGPIRVSSSRR